MTDKRPLKIDVFDYLNRRVIFTIKKLKEKIVQHPELGNNAFIKNVEKALKDPDEVWQDYSDKINKVCYYKKHSATSYAKVVVWKSGDPIEIITAYEVDRIKEQRYQGLKKLK